MTDPVSANSNFHALLIACDFYFPNLLPNGGKFNPLGGCVRDIERVEQELLLGRLQVPPENILKLTSRAGEGGQPAEPPEQRPTYENIVKKFEELAERAGPGDQVYIHYSGHGGRIRTRFPELKGEDGVDETLVPIDIANKSTRYVRDIDLAYTLKKMVDKGLIVTIVLDSCHSGGATRNAGSQDMALRTAEGWTTSEQVDETERPTDSKFASDAELAAAWQGLSQNGTRNASVGGGWLPEPEGYVLMAACRPSESAIEYAFEGQGRSGLLTYWLLEVFKRLGPNLTWKLVHDQVLTKIRTLFPSQTPQVQGEVGRVVFGVDTIPPQYAVNVLKVEKVGVTGRRVKLNTGQALGVATGAEFAVFPPGTIDFTKTEQRLALVTVKDLGATESWAEVKEEFGHQEIEQGAQAVLTDAVKMRRRVRLLTEENHLTAEHKAVLEAVEQSIGSQGRGFMEVAAEGAAAEYQLGISLDGQEFEILDPKGTPFPNQRPVIEAVAGHAPLVAERLDHLSKYHTILELRNYDSQSQLAGKLKVELARAPADYKRGDKPNPLPLEDPGNAPVVKEGDKLFLHIRNDSPQVLNVAVLDLQPDWGITQFYPSEASGDFIPIDPHKDIWVVTEFYLPEPLTEGTDVFKAFATLGPANFRWLELPSLAGRTRAASERGLHSGPRNPFEKLLAELGSERAETRNTKPPAEASDEWVVVEVSVMVKKA